MAVGIAHASAATSRSRVPVAFCSYPAFNLNAGSVLVGELARAAEVFHEYAQPPPDYAKLAPGAHVLAGNHWNARERRPRRHRNTSARIVGAPAGRAGFPGCFEGRQVNC